MCNRMAGRHGVRLAVVRIALILAACETDELERRADGGARTDASAEAARGTTRESLSALSDALLTALQSDHAGALLASDAHVTENGRTISVRDSLLTGTRRYPYRTFFAEPGAGQAALFGVADVGDSPLVFSLRLRAEGSAISELEIITARPGEASVAAPANLKTPDPMYETLVPMQARRSRAELIAIADAYFDAIEQSTGAEVPFADGCNRFENGVQTTNNGMLSSLTSLSCRDGLAYLFYIETVRDRRYPIVDEQRGLVFAQVAFDMPGGPYRAEINGQIVERDRVPNTLLLGEVFKIQDGRIQRIEATMRNLPLGTPTGWPAH